MIQTIIGKRGRGKTTLAKQFIKESTAAQIHILDFLGEYHDLNDDRLTIARDSLYGFCQFAWESSSPRFKTLVVFDEIDLYGKNDPHISFLYRYGRHKALDLIGVSRRFYDLPVIIRALTDEFCLFQITEERDTNYLKRFISDDILSKIIHLGNYQYIKIPL
ncbi:hypothetical protein ES702_06840 [subsurface metagenome]